MKNLKMLFLVVILLFPTQDLFAGGSNKVLLMATTTSTDNTGLLDYLAPYFTKTTGIDLRWVSTGTGKAFELGKKGDVDLLFVHAPEVEMDYIKDGFGIKRCEVMFNNFALIGPISDPAKIKDLDILRALDTIKKSGATFLSRADNSGTNIREMSLWKNVDWDIICDEDWYVQTGQGMLATLNIAVELNGYTITDMGTYIKYCHSFDDDLPIQLFVEGGDKLKNQYSVLLLNPKNCSGRNLDSATIFLDWITGCEGQELIQRFTIDGKKIFIPNAN